MIRFRLLGSLDLRGSGGQDLGAVLAQPRRAALLAYLAVAIPAGPHRRDTLLALFWPEHDADHARNALNQAVHFLRRSLGAGTIVNRNGDALSLDWREFWCDAVAFGAALDANRATEALELYRGDLLEGFHVADAPGFERWRDGERARLAARYTKAVESEAEALEAVGDVRSAVANWRRLAVRDPYDSRVALRLIRTLAAAGNPAEAIQHARTHETLLRQDFDVEPDREITAMVGRLQSGHSQIEPPVTRPEPAAADAQIVHTSASAAATSGDRTRLGRRRMLVFAASVLAFSTVAGGAAMLNRRMSVAAPTIRSFAVLPLVNLSGDSAQQRFADGMHDALITELARYPDLFVISRTSALQYTSTKKSLRDIARELKVDGIVEGTLLWEGARVRMNAQLIHGTSDRHIWADTYERDLRDVLLLQGELAKAIARQVRVVTTPVARTARPAIGPSDSAPQELYLRELLRRGVHAEMSRSPVGVQTAKEAYRRAVERDSTFALGYAGLAGVYGFIADYRFGPVRPALDTARMMARRAVSLDSTLPETRTALAMTLGDARDFEGAEREFKRAIALGPSSARAHYWYSILLVALGRGEEAMREARRAEDLDPFAPRGVLSMRRNAEFLITGKRPHLKLPVREQWPILKLEPGEPWALGREAEALAKAGRCAEARTEIERAEQLVPNNARMLPLVGLVYWRCGERARARALLAKMKRRPDAHENGLRITILHAEFGDIDSAFVWLQRHHWSMAELAGFSASALFDPLRSDRRFVEVMKSIGIR